MLKPFIALLVFFLGVAALYAVEGKWAHMPFVALITFLIAALIFLVSKRLAFSAYASLVLVYTTTLMSVAKFGGQGFDLHIYDFAFTGTDIEAIKFLMSEYAAMIGPVLVFVAIGIAILANLWKLEKKRNTATMARAIPPAITVLLLPVTYPANSGEPRYFYYLAGFNASSFYVSFLDIATRFEGETTLKRLAAAPEAEAFEPHTNCNGFDVKPDIFVVLSESATDLRIYPQINIESLPQHAFQSEDGRSHGLRVDSFGGGTWISNLALMNGMPIRDFGWRAPYLTVQMQGKIQGSLAQLLAPCGYRAGVVMPMKHGFVNEGPFLHSTGFDTVWDYDAIGASMYNHRDDFYYDAAHRVIDEHIAKDGRPLFLQVQTMFAHSPFEEPRAPEIQFQDAPYVDDPLLNEHVRRVLIAQQDFHAFIEQRRKSQPNRPFVVLEFGDHQTQGMKPFADELAGNNSLSDPNSLAYRTYFTVHSHGFELDHSKFDDAPLDIGFLGVSFMQAIGVPLSPLYEDLARLRDLCDGAFEECKNRDAVDLHLKRRESSGFIAFPGS